jgi:RNA exonuclease 1
MAPQNESAEIYAQLRPYVMRDDRLKQYGYPEQDPQNPEMRVARDQLGRIQVLRDRLASSYECWRCKRTYQVDDEGRSLPSSGECVYHYRNGPFYVPWLRREGWTCCNGHPNNPGCCRNRYHVHREQPERKNFEGYVQTQPKPERDPNGHGVYALDCEMCCTNYGLELIRVAVVDWQHQVVYDRLVKPTNPILNYNTETSGIREGDLVGVSTTLADVQRDLLDLFSDKTILVGHSLDSDMKALKIFHKTFIDTAELFPHRGGLPKKRALRTLVESILGERMHENAARGHDCKEDAIAALRLVKWKCLR